VAGSRLSNVVFMFSYDGVNFDRRYREAFIRPGHDPNNWHERAIRGGAGLVPTVREKCRCITWSTTGTDSVHRFRRGVLRTDGLVSCKPAPAEARSSTRPLTSCREPAGDELSTSAAGSVRVELQAADGTAARGIRG